MSYNLRVENMLQIVLLWIFPHDKVPATRNGYSFAGTDLKRGRGVLVPQLD
ncbi:MAG: hypothetical protein F6K41_01205 [Symploca sp. SIO3E6]|nr:hypothetical protein [Caldora sp. SIO3E6]